MADLWFTADQLREAAGAKQAGDQARLDLAARVAAKHTRLLTGPVSPPETITERIRLRVPTDAVPLKYRPASLVSVLDYPSGTVRTLTDYDFEDQLLIRKDGGLICGHLTVTYTAGYVGDVDDPIPDELVSMATLIGQQYLRVSKRFSLTDDQVTGIGFLVPDAAKDIGRDFLLAPEGIG